MTENGKIKDIPTTYGEYKRQKSSCVAENHKTEDIFKVPQVPPLKNRKLSNDKEILQTNKENNVSSSKAGKNVKDVEKTVNEIVTDKQDCNDKPDKNAGKKDVMSCDEKDTSTETKVSKCHKSRNSYV